MPVDIEEVPEVIAVLPHTSDPSGNKDPKAQWFNLCDKDVTVNITNDDEKATFKINKTEFTSGHAVLPLEDGTLVKIKVKFVSLNAQAKFTRGLILIQEKVKDLKLSCPVMIIAPVSVSTCSRPVDKQYTFLFVKEGYKAGDTLDEFETYD